MPFASRACGPGPEATEAAVGGATNEDPGRSQAGEGFRKGGWYAATVTTSGIRRVQGEVAGGAEWAYDDRTR